MSATVEIISGVVEGIWGPSMLRKCATERLPISCGDVASMPETLMRMMIALKAFLAVANVFWIAA